MMVYILLIIIIIIIIIIFYVINNLLSNKIDYFDNMTDININNLFNYCSDENIANDVYYYIKN